MNGITDTAVMDELDLAGLHFTNRGRYIITQCPNPDHDDKSPSCQIYKDDWFANCHGPCGRFHITKYLPALKALERPQERREMSKWENTRLDDQKAVERTPDTKYATFELYNEWASMDPIPRDHGFKGIPLTVLDKLGWRFHRESYFIPYFTENRDSIPFAQWRHLSGERRFTNLKDAKPTVYGKWNLKPGGTYFIVEGTSDCAALEYAGVPWIGMISSSDGVGLRNLIQWANMNGVHFVYGGDRDDAGNKLLDVLEETADSFRVKQPPAEYKDYGEMLIAKGPHAVYAWCSREIPKPPKPADWEELSDIEKIQAVFPGSTEIKIT